MNLRINRDIVNWDPYVSAGLTNIMSAYMEKLYADDWTLNPSVFSYQISWRPTDFVYGCLAEKWEYSDPNTYVVHLRKGIRWQDIPPANGREFTADDVAYHFNRVFGMGGYGFTKPSPYYATGQPWNDLKSTIALDKYTVAFKWGTSSLEFINETMQALSNVACIENPEAVKQWGDVGDWHHAIGTGAFIVKDYVSGSSVTLARNSNYWANDERYPQNKLPYIDTCRILIIPDTSTTLAALRTGKIDIIDGISLQDAQSVKKTNPGILQLTTPTGSGLGVEPNDSVKPYSDIRVRKAMQMAIDLPTIASTYYGGTVSASPVALTSAYVSGWGFPYEQWPQDLKDEYAYNPTAAKKLLSDAGFPNGFKANIIASTAGDLDLLQIVQHYFTAVGIDMTIQPMDDTAFMAIFNARKLDQLGYTKGGVIGATVEPTRQLQRFKTGYVGNIYMVSDPVFDTFYDKALAATTVDGVKQALKDANEYAARQHWVVSLVQPKLYTLYQPWFKGYNGQSNSIAGATSGVLLSFYLSRFWIDLNLQKSMSH
jgi:peptide/nickel transport system substrate-binding protein